MSADYLYAVNDAIAASGHSARAAVHAAWEFCTMRHTIEEFSHAIHGEASQKPVHGGEIHSMTRYVLNYCGLLVDCRGTLDAVLGNAGLNARMWSGVGAA